MIVLYAGKGKGKTTAALGTALRALGQNCHVLVIQFMKKTNTGEYKIRKKLRKLNYEIYQFGRKKFVNLKAPSENDKKLAEKGFEFAKKSIKKIKNKTKTAKTLIVKRTLLILDEINLAVSCGLLKEKEVLDFLSEVKKIKNLDIILTGRNASKKLMEKSDIVTIMQEKKYKGGARKCIEY